jgi:hypothetical protein
MTGSLGPHRDVEEAVRMRLDEQNPH